MALMLPWILLLFILVFDFGFYAYSAMVTENAARAAALRAAVSQNAAVDQGLACVFARREFLMFPNVSQDSDCTALPLDVGTPPCTIDGEPAACVEVTYQTPQFFPLPWLMGQMTLTREAQVRIYR